MEAGLSVMLAPFPFALRTQTTLP